MKLEDIQPGRRYYVNFGGGECRIGTVLVVLDDAQVVVTYSSGMAWIEPATALLAPVPHSWLQRLLKGGD